MTDVTTLSTARLDYLEKLATEMAAESTPSRMMVMTENGVEPFTYCSCAELLALITTARRVEAVEQERNKARQIARLLFLGAGPYDAESTAEMVKEINSWR